MNKVNTLDLEKLSTEELRSLLYERASAEKMEFCDELRKKPSEYVMEMAYQHTIYDEYLSLLEQDYLNEEQIKNALEELAKNHTIMTIAHRLNTIENAECIYVLQKGRIVQKGTHRELMDSEGVYSRLYRMSSEEEADA